MVEWIKIDSVEDFSDDVRVYIHEDVPIAVFKLEDGFYAIDDTCSHDEASLSEGEIEDHEIECPMHGARFDITSGENLSFPAVVPVNSYPVKVENGDIYIKVEEV
jgi:nitrite reductase/ring-hydroxylating ferredoxin subunit